MKYPKRNRRYADVLEEIYDIHDSLTEEEYYDSLYYVLGNTYPDASDEELEEIFEEMLENMSEQQAEDFMSSLGSIGKKIGTGLAKVPDFLSKNPELLSTIGGIAGNLILPGAGGMIGGALGSAAGGLMQNKNGQNNMPQQQQNPNAIVNSDAAKLNSMMQDPQMQRALAANVHEQRAYRAAYKWWTNNARSDCKLPTRADSASASCFAAVRRAHSATSAGGFG
jgi:hypothetical protein